MNYIRILLGISLLASAVCCGYMVMKIYTEMQRAKTEKRHQLEKAIDQGTEAVTKRIQAIYTLSESLQRLATERKTISDIETILKEIVVQNPDILSCSIAYAPNMYNPEVSLLSRRAVRTQEGIIVYALETKEDYTNTDWYRNAQSGAPLWTQPFLDDITKQRVLRYSLPFFITNPETQTQTFGGIVNVTMPLLALDMFILTMSFDKETYVMLIHENGTLLAHPTEILTKEEKTIMDLVRKPGQQELLQLYNQLKHSDEGERTITNDVQQNLFKAVFKRIAGTPWFLIFVHLENSNIISSQSMLRLFILCLLATIFFIISLLSLVFYACCSGARAAWLASSSCAALLALAIATIWTLDITSDIPDVEHPNLVNNEYSLKHFLFIQQKINPHIYKKDTAFIPTGIYINSFEAGHNATITLGGQVWQKYDRKKYPELEPNIIFLDATEQKLEKVYTTQHESIETIGWRFQATFQANFNYLKYPFDEQQIPIALGHKDYLTNVILIPDFEAYVSDESAKAEINPKVESNLWVIKQTYLFYELTNFTTDFGVEEFEGQKGFPILNVGVRIRRQFVYPLTASTLPVVIILFVVFSILLFIGLTKHRDSLATEVIKLTSSIFFATAIAHQTFQRSLQSPVITYFEYFYFLIYLIILLTAINGMLYAYNRGGTFISTCNNIIARLLYWPITLTLGLILTLVFFY